MSGKRDSVVAAIRRFAAAAARYLLAGMIAGFLAAGVGSRLAMRVTALMTDARRQGTLTEADAIVGDVTLEGTLFLVFFGTIVIGCAGGALYAMLRGWLGSGRWVGLRFGALGLAIGGTAVISGENFDFKRFGSPAVNVLMYATLFLLYGVLVARAEGALSRRTIHPLLQIVLLGLGAWMAVAGLSFGSDQPIEKLALPLLGALAILAAAIAHRLAGPARVDEHRFVDRVHWAGGAVLIALAMYRAWGLAQEAMAIVSK